MDLVVGDIDRLLLEKKHTVIKLFVLKKGETDFSLDAPHDGGKFLLDRRGFNVSAHTAKCHRHFC